jgi:hypothetical protein
MNLLARISSGVRAGTGPADTFFIEVIPIPVPWRQPSLGSRTRANEWLHPSIWSGHQPPSNEGLLLSKKDKRDLAARLS